MMLAIDLRGVAGTYMLYFSDINECLSNPCQHGSCADDIDYYICTCNSGYDGIRCDSDKQY